jgi:hydrogenase expression/formation protein HypE
MSPREDTKSLARKQQVLDRIDKARRRRPKVREERITLSHGSGGKATQTLIEAVFLEAFGNPLLAPLEDAAQFTVDGARLALTTDSFVVSPLFFPGGTIGDLAVNGTVNDLAVSGARPLYLTAGFILEEGFPVADLTRIVESMTRAAAQAGVQIVTGDTKVVQRGKADGCYLNIAGVGVLERPGRLGVATARPGDAVLVTGPIGEHGVTIISPAGNWTSTPTSNPTPHRSTDSSPGCSPPCRGFGRCAMPPRGRVATILNEIARAAEVSIVVDEQAVPVSTEVRGASELLGIDPLYVACEGRAVVVVDGTQAQDALAALRAHPLGSGAAIIGRIADDPAGLVLLNTAFGGTRIVDLLVGDPLPRIC